MTTIPQRHGETDRHADRKLAVAIRKIAYMRCRLQTHIFIL